MAGGLREKKKLLEVWLWRPRMLMQSPTCDYIYKPKKRDLFDDESFSSLLPRAGEQPANF